MPSEERREAANELAWAIRQVSEGSYFHDDNVERLDAALSRYLLAWLESDGVDLFEDAILRRFRQSR